MTPDSTEILVFMTTQAVPRAEDMLLERGVDVDVAPPTARAAGVLPASRSRWRRRLSGRRGVARDRADPVLPR